MPGSAEAAIDELVVARSVEGDAEVPIDSLDRKCWTEKVVIADEEVWRSDHAAVPAFRIVGLYIGVASADVVHGGELTYPQQFGRIGEVAAFFEECLAELEADLFAAMHVDLVRAGGERKRRQGGHREQVWIECGEEIGGHGVPKISHLFHQQFSWYSFAVDEFKRPGAYSDRNVSAVPLLSECEETP